MNEPLTKSKVSYQFFGKEMPKMMDIESYETLVHLKDVRSAVTGLKETIKKQYTGLHEAELLQWIDDFFPVFKG